MDLEEQRAKLREKARKRRAGHRRPSKTPFKDLPLEERRAIRAAKARKRRARARPFDLKGYDGDVELEITLNRALGEVFGLDIPLFSHPDEKLTRKIRKLQEEYPGTFAALEQLDDIIKSALDELDAPLVSADWVHALVKELQQVDYRIK